MLASMAGQAALPRLSVVSLRALHTTSATAQADTMAMEQQQALDALVSENEASGLCIEHHCETSSSIKLLVASVFEKTTVHQDTIFLNKLE